MSSRIVSTSKDFNPATFRYWQDINTVIYDVLYHRNPYANYYAEGIVREAFVKGFDYMLGDKEHPNNEEILSHPLFNDMMEKTILAIAQKRANTFAVMIWVKMEDQPEEQLYWLSWEDLVSMEIIPFTMDINYIEFHPPVYAVQTVDFTPIKLGKKDSSTPIVNVKLMANYGKKSGQFRSIFEPIFDDLVGLTNISQQIVIKQIRIGSGIRNITVPWEMYADKEAMTKFEGQLENMGVNSLMITPGDKDGVAKVELYFGEGSMSSKEDKEEILGNIAAYTRIPIEAWKGSMLGVRSGDANRDMLLNQYSKINTDEEEYVLWNSLKQFNELLSDSIEGVWLRFKPLSEEDPKELIAIIGQKLDIIQKLAPDYNRLGIVQKELYSLIDLDLKIDKALIAEFEEEKEALMNTMNTEGNEDGENVDESQSSEDTTEAEDITEDPTET